MRSSLALGIRSKVRGARLTIMSGLAHCRRPVRLWLRLMTMTVRCVPLPVLALVLLISSFAGLARAQTGGHMLYGDLKVDERNVDGLKPISLDIILYTDTGVVVGRQAVSNNGRYRFNNLRSGWYDVVVEVESKEVARVRVDLTSPLLIDRQQDISLEWRSTSETRSKPGVLSAADRYVRGATNEALFREAREATDRKEYDRAAELLQRIVKSDAKDFQAWAELANVHFLQKNLPVAETEYLRAIDAHPGFFLALFNLGRLEIALKKYDVAVEVLAKAVNARTESADANYFLGEAYLQLKKGSQAVGYLNEAIRLDPKGMADVHLRLATLYNGAGMKDKAAAEYEAFLKKKPDYPDRQKLQQYIAANKKQ